MLGSSKASILSLTRLSVHSHHNRQDGNRVRDSCYPVYNGEDGLFAGHHGVHHGWADGAVWVNSTVEGQEPVTS